MKISPLAKTYLFEGEDFLARREMAEALQEVINESNAGEISLPEFVERINDVAKCGKVLLKP